MRYMTGGNVAEDSFVGYIARTVKTTIQRGLDRGDDITTIVDSIVELKELEMQRYCSEKGTAGRNDYFSNVWSMARRQGAKALPENLRKEFLEAIRWGSWRRSKRRGRETTVPAVTTGESWFRGLRDQG